MSKWLDQALFIDHDVTLAAAGSAAAVGLVLQAAEFAKERQLLLEDFFSWKVIRSRYYITLRRPLTRAVIDILCASEVFVPALGIQAVLAVAFPFVVAGGSGAMAGFIALSVFLLQCLMKFRILVGLDGSDQMQAVVWAGLTAMSFGGEGSHLSMAAGLFISGQLLLSYVVAGWAKLISTTWRSGRAIPAIVKTTTYGSPFFHRCFSLPGVGFLTAWWVMLFESFSPLALIFGRAGAAVLFVVGMSFHLGVAVVMGLWSFLWAFLACFPVLF